jgi:PIN domain nuclease of toxin-antitoxin system
VRLVSPISSAEIAITANRGLVAFTGKHLESLVFDLNLTVFPRSAEHSMGLFGLPAHHRDPLDRALIAIALAESAPLVAKDREFKNYRGLRTIWQI